MRINHNIAALNTHRQLTGNQNATQSSLEKLSSGLRINKAGDDAAGLAISEKMRGQIRGLDMAAKNAQDGISLIQTAEGALNETQSILQRMRELAVQSSNDTNTDSDRAEIQKEADQLAQELTRIADDTEFNTQNLLGGEFNATFHIGANEGQNVELSINNMSGEALGVALETTETIDEDDISLAAGTYNVVNLGGVEVFSDATEDAESITANYGLQNADGEIVAISADGETYTELATATEISDLADAEYAETDPNTIAFGTAVVSGTVTVSEVSDEEVTVTANRGINISTQAAADAAITTIQTAIDNVSAERSKLGAMQNRLDHTINNLGTSSENLTAAESRIRDVDMASEMMEFTKNNILSQAAQSMLAQANSAPQGVLQLLQ